MAIRCKCDNCGVSLKVKDELAGTDGKCPQCKHTFHIPGGGEPEGGSADSDAELQTTGDDSSEEDDIFGKDFFTMKEASPGPRYTMPPAATAGGGDDDDDSEDEPVSPAKRGPSKPFSAARPSSVDNSASIASDLLSKTGKKNRSQDFVEDDQDGKVEYDFSEIRYLLLQRILPSVGVGTVVFGLLYWMIAGSESNLPDLADVHGKVTLNGIAVPQAQIFFTPEMKPTEVVAGGSSFAVSGPDGSYVALYREDAEGAVPGRHEVMIVVEGVRHKRSIEVADGDNEKNFEIGESFVPGQ